MCHISKNGKLFRIKNKVLYSPESKKTFKPILETIDKNLLISFQLFIVFSVP